MGSKRRRGDGARVRKRPGLVQLAMNSLCDSEEVTSHLWAVTSFLKWLWYLLNASCGPQHLVAGVPAGFSQYNHRKWEMCV